MPTAAERYKFSEVESDGKTFMTEIFEQSKVHRVEDVKIENVMRMGNKDVLAKHLVNALKLIERQNMLVINQRVHASSYREEIMKLQSNVIDTQKKEMDKFKREVCQDITETVQNSVNTGIKSYSDAVKSCDIGSSSPVISKEALKTVAKQVAVEEELSKNVMLFCLPEEENEDLNQSVREVFEQLGEKPSFEATRLGRKKESSIRPIKVVLSSVSSAQSILFRSRDLRSSEKYKSVYASPDRTVEERIHHRELVQQLKRKIIEEPQKKHFIKGGCLQSVDKCKLAT